MTVNVPLVHAVTSHAILDSPDFLARTASLGSIVRLSVHLRSRIHGGRRLVDLGTALMRSFQASIFVNDRADVARAIQAQGVHLPSAGMPTADVRDLVGSRMLIGRSAHTPEEAIAAHDGGADYVFLGPIWPTESHPGEPGIGVGAIARARSVPVIAIGGITPELVPRALDAGAHGVAAVSAIWRAPDPAAAVERMLLSFHL